MSPGGAFTAPHGQSDGEPTPYTLKVPYTFISDVDIRVLCWDAFCFHRTSSKNTTKLGCQGEYMKPK